MLRGICQGYVKRIFRFQTILQPAKKRYSERRRRKGDGTKTDIFEERSAASQEEYFRKETARQLEQLKKQQKQREEKLRKELEEKAKDESHESDNRKQKPSSKKDK